MFEAIGYVIGSLIVTALILTPTVIAWLRDHHCKKTVALLNILAPGFTPVILLLPFMIMRSGFNKTSEDFMWSYIILGFCGWIGVTVWASVGRKATVFMSAKGKTLTLAGIIVVVAAILAISGHETAPLEHAANQPVQIPKKAADM